VLGSFAFHGTLLYGAQLLDELPMIWATCIFVFCAVLAVFPTLALSTTLATTLRLGLALYSLVVTLLYTTLLKHTPVFHEVAYGLLVFLLVVVLTIGVCRAPPQQRGVLLGLFWRSLLSYGVGFALWNVDNLFCGHVRDLRAQMSQAGATALTPVLQLHMWWHIAQVGSYDCITLLVMLDHCNHRVQQLTVQYTLGGIVPLVRACKEIASTSEDSKST